MASTWGAIPAADSLRQDLKELSDSLVGELASAEQDAGQRAEEDAEREQRDDEGERHRARHGESAVLIEAVDGFEHGAVALHTKSP